MKEKLLVENFKTIGGNHCQTTALLHLLNHRDLKLSEDMLLGLGGGIGFIYWYMKLMPAPFVGGRNGKVEEFILNACSRIGAKAQIFQTASQKKAFEELKSILRGGDPAYVFVDMAYLPYLALPEEAHFGGHTVAVFGIDEEKNQVNIADRGRHPFMVKVEDIASAMSSKFPPFAAKNKILKIRYPDRIINLEKGIRDSIKDCIRAFLYPPIKNFGFSGMEKWANLLNKWPDLFQGLSLFGALFNVFIYIEIGGTGGSAFRPMYARFLKESSGILKEPALQEVAEIFFKSAEIWTRIANAALPDSWKVLRQLKEYITEKNRIFENEDAGSLQKLLDINKKSETLMHQAAKEMEKYRSTRLADLLASLKSQILQCQEIEKEAFSKLEKIMR